MNRPRKGRLTSSLWLLPAAVVLTILYISNIQSNKNSNNNSSASKSTDSHTSLPKPSAPYAPSLALIYSGLLTPSQEVESPSRRHLTLGLIIVGLEQEFLQKVTSSCHHCELTVTGAADPGHHIRAQLRGPPAPAGADRQVGQLPAAPVCSGGQGQPGAGGQAAGGLAGQDPGHQAAAGGEGGRWRWRWRWR